MALTLQAVVKRRIQRHRRPMAHVDNGWPHHSSNTPYHCICLDDCCHDEQGCRCKSCVCQGPKGIPHGTKTVPRKETVPQKVGT
jgi:hypothetical protein